MVRNKILITCLLLFWTLITHGDAIVSTNSDHECSKPTELLHGHVKIPPKLEFLSELEYTCEKGYELIGPSHRVCQGDELWSGLEPFCTPLGVRCEMPHFNVENGYPEVYQFSGRKKFYVNETIAYECETGFRASPFGNSKTTCQMDSKDNPTWKPKITIECEEESNSDGKCTLLLSSREHLIAFYDGANFTDKDYIFPNGAILYLRCLEYGLYKFIGQSKLTCRNGNWSHEVPECKRNGRSGNRTAPIIDIFEDEEGLLLTETIFTTDDGVVLIPKNRIIYVACYSVTYDTKLNVYQRNNSKLEKIGWKLSTDFVAFISSATKTSGKITCVNRYTDMTLNYLVADVCGVINEYRLHDETGMRIIKGQRKSLYAEDDLILTECFTGYRTNEHYLQCSTNSRWVYPKNVC